MAETWRRRLLRIPSIRRSWMVETKTFVVVTICGAAFTTSGVSAEPIEVTGLLNLDYGMDFDGSSVLGRASLELEAFKRPSEWTAITAIGRAELDVSDRLEPGKPSQDNRSRASRRLLVGNEGEFELRELYADIDIDSAVVRAGKQQIVWGQADGLKVLDVVNPQSFREFIIDEFDNSRTPLWSVAAQIPYGDVMLELVWLPDTTYADIPSRDAYFAILSPQFVLPPTPGKRPIIQDLDRPNRIIEDSDAGFSLSAPVQNWDLSLNYLYQYNDLPQFRYFDDATTSTVVPVYIRTHMIGGSFSTSISQFTIRGEIAYFSDRSFTIDRRKKSIGSVAKEEVSYVMGLDWTGIANTFVSAQFFQSILPDYESGIFRDEIESNVTFTVKHTFNNDLTKASVKDITSINHGDGYVEVSVDHELSDQVGIGVKLVQFYGRQRDIFGQFDERDFAGINLSFGF
jgi:hypothetical protein